jgi:resuscitation-promoting factor RpfA
MQKAPDAFRTISEASDALQVPAHVLRFWESKFSQVKPVKRAGGRRYYRPADIDLLSGIKTLLYDQGMTIRGVQKLIADKGVRQIAQIAPLAEEMVSGPQSPVPETTPAPKTSPERGPVPNPVPATAPSAVAPQEQADAATLPPRIAPIEAAKPSRMPVPGHLPGGSIRAGALAHALRMAPPAPDRIQAAKPLLARLEALRVKLDRP